MITRREKIKHIRRYAPVLLELALEYNKGASIAEKLPDEAIKTMFRIACETDRLHNKIANQVEDSDE